jgi:hypothetical protein
MKKITEDFLHFLWMNQHLAGITLLDETGLHVEVIHPGEHNHDAGPDFFNARISIGGTTWAGNVEIHVNASDWIRHGHQHDDAYNSVILHVVYYNDCVITSGGDRVIPAVTLRFPRLLWENYELFMKRNTWISCSDRLRELSALDVAHWTSRLMVEKLTGRCNAITEKSTGTMNHRDAILHSEICRCFGLPVNSFPFEMLAKAAPLNSLMRHKGSQFSLEALLLGKAGMLSTALPEDRYFESLRHEYLRIGPRIDTQEIDPHLWKYSRMRPSSFPSLRIAQLAALIHHSYPLMEHLEPMPRLDQLRELLRVRAGDYWNTHVVPGKCASKKSRYTGNDFIDRIIINGIIPFLFYLSRSSGSDAFRDYSTGLLEEIPAESNAIIKKWTTFGLQSANAFESQALLYLYRNYCRQKKCLSCQFGNTFIIHGKKPA